MQDTCGGKVGLEVKLPLKVTGFGHEDIARNAEMPHGTVPRTAPLPIWCSVVRHHNHDIVVAVRTCLTSRYRTE